MLDSEELKHLLIDTSLGKQPAFSRLYTLTSPILFSVSLRLLRDRALAEEALQEAFVNVWYKASEYSPDKGEAFPWLVSVVRYKSLDILRRENSHANRQTSLAQEHEIDADLMVSDDLSDLTDLDSLTRCLDELQPKQRQSLLLAFYHGYSHSELVTKLESPLGTVKSWIRRAMHSVRECMSI